jgi:threonine synthase
MDIQSASNFERLYFEGVKRDPVETTRAFTAFAKTGAIDIPPGALSAMQATFTGVAIGEDETVRTIVSTLNETGELIDPHTAVAVSALRHVALDGPTVVLSTAHPAKFPEDVAKASGVTPGLPRGTASLAGRRERFDRLPGEADTIKAYVRAFAEA